MEVDEYQQNKTISVIIKTPSQAQEEMKVAGVSLDWTVKELKTHLSTLYSDTLAVSDQRLIYGGKLLPDHLHMKDLFRQTDSIPILHLVCATRSPAQGPGARPKTKETQQPQNFPPPSSHLSSTAQTLRQRRETSSSSSHVHNNSQSWPPAAAAVPAAPPLSPPAFPTYSLYSPQQLLWLQHVYARQYYMQYHAALTSAHTHLSVPAAAIGQRPSAGPTHQIPVPDPLANQNPINNLPANQNPVQDAAFMDQGREANQNMRVNAQGGPVMENEEDVERDWLDWLYSAAQFTVLLVIIYFNSNLSRFLLIISTLLLMYLHTAGRFPFRRPAPVQEPDQAHPPEAQNNDRNPNPADDLADPQREGPDPAADASNGPMTAVLVPPHRVSVMWTLWVFFKTFFSSLIPEAPQGVAN